MNEQPRKSIVERVQMILYRVEDSILVGLLLLMITMAVLQIFLRNLFDTGIVWSDILVRILVLWVGLAGAMVASRQGNHINIDIMDRFLPERAKVVVNFVVEVFTALICAIVAYYSLQFVQMEFADGGMAFAKVPAWLCEAVIPFAFLVIAIRYVLLSIINLKRIVKFRS
ncbi:MAG: TRAP transporter small permease subunit [Deltaproteobacteria bacterium]|jgi:TRAP-type C4-dicarboxylate transport system permease small subunit|nr:TRAP transporter small permease subunit [Deltaproteobacteria bacterium]MBW2572334.1 TRAP transporter small permease subunit [Deltaproteobacteria bacterium]MBW2670089.1 TRAP transporter small permease subunit [Deltaproteobacteria bacterium]MBW2711115.1 TRAP transporter small permease subunit [Deltaproteobacteria bacterium]